ncbi:MAG: tripartite tricarboxylate transporter TctB family protein [Rhodoferax sp.]|nr:tripartite tricarboxylate transporter TctB family protein [Rhodoferax sp.]
MQAMSLRKQNLNEVFAGGFLILAALLAFYLAWPLSRGTEVGLGPGFVPYMFATAQTVVGAIMVVHGLATPGEAPEPWHLRPLVLVLLSVVFFAMSIQRLGLVVAIFGLVMIGCAANRGTTWREALAVAIGSVVVCALVFVKALGLSIALWPVGLEF